MHASYWHNNHNLSDHWHFSALQYVAFCDCLSYTVVFTCFSCVGFRQYTDTQGIYSKWCSHVQYVMQKTNAAACHVEHNVRSWVQCLTILASYSFLSKQLAAMNPLSPQFVWLHCKQIHKLLFFCCISDRIAMFAAPTGWYTIHTIINLTLFVQHFSKPMLQSALRKINKSM